MTCKDCLHYEVCDCNDNYDHHASSLCDHFKNKARGRWKGAGMGDYTCSLCDETASGNDYKYCPNCGAYMKG